MRKAESWYSDTVMAGLLAQTAAITPEQVGLSLRFVLGFLRDSAVLSNTFGTTYQQKTLPYLVVGSLCGVLARIGGSSLHKLLLKLWSFLCPGSTETSVFGKM